MTVSCPEWDINTDANGGDHDDWNVIHQPQEQTITMHIKACGNQEWTQQLYNIALRDYEYKNAFDIDIDETSQSVSNLLILKKLRQLSFYADGPYGSSLDFQGYDRVILIGGGIGITPCHSIFATYLKQCLLKKGKLNVAIDTIMNLIWITKKSDDFAMFNDTWNLYKKYIDTIKDNGDYADNDGGIINNINGRNQFGIDLYATREDKTLDKKERTLGGNTIEWKSERPSINRLLGEYSKGNKALVFVCGPDVLVDDCERAALAFNMHFVCESFEF